MFDHSRTLVDQLQKDVICKTKRFDILMHNHVSIELPKLCMYIVKNTRVSWTVLSWSRTELLPQVDGIQTDRGAACAALAGYVTLTARNGDSMMHGVLPSVIPHHSAALNSCFPGSDGNWWVKKLHYAALNRKSNILWTGKRAFFEHEKWTSFEWENQHPLNRKTNIL